ncbi:MAG: alcohol dehydrogenase catalytic domain-containing protein, partial [Firmicutes bacterium]|nr:alcohol dehydrogenase catalytic domain-containing protein [Bacillota bacterium]
MRVADYPVPQPEVGECLVGIVACGLCGTDVKLRAGKVPGVRYPLVLGHEPAGVEVETGRRVAVYPHLSCGRCVNCVEGRENVCLRSGGTLGITAQGALAEYARVPERNLVDLPEGVDFAEGALAGGVVAVSLCAVRKMGAVLDQWVVVAGLGGLGAALWCRGPRLHRREAPGDPQEARRPKRRPDRARQPRHPREQGLS